MEEIAFDLFMDSHLCVLMDNAFDVVGHNISLNTLIIRTQYVSYDETDSEIYSVGPPEAKSWPSPILVYVYDLVFESAELVTIWFGGDSNSFSTDKMLRML